MKFSDMRAMLQWRDVAMGRVSAERLTRGLSCEGLPYEQIPEQHYAAVVGFRRRTADERLRVAQKYCALRGAK